LPCAGSLIAGVSPIPTAAILTYEDYSPILEGRLMR
jgi:hypothetical protein